MPKNNKAYVLKVGSGGRIQIPHEYATFLGLKPGDFAAVELTTDGRITVYPVDFIPRK